jgi:hypothetical protein
MKRQREETKEIVEDKELTDTIIVCEDGEIDVVRYLLCKYSPVFTSMFKSNMKECQIINGKWRITLPEKRETIIKVMSIPFVDKNALLTDLIENRLFSPIVSFCHCYQMMRHLNIIKSLITIQQQWKIKSEHLVLNKKFALGWDFPLFKMFVYMVMKNNVEILNVGDDIEILYRLYINILKRMLASDINFLDSIFYSIKSCRKQGLDFRILLYFEPGLISHPCICYILKYLPEDFKSVLMEHLLFKQNENKIPNKYKSIADVAGSKYDNIVNEFKEENKELIDILTGDV